jgi:MtN3 and saliva related transmembrane protein
MTPWQIEIIGLVAAVLTTFAFVPQVLKIWRNKNAAGVSLTMYLVLFTGILLWLAYGILLDRLAIILANSFTACLQLIIIVLKLKHR